MSPLECLIISLNFYAILFVYLYTPIGYLVKKPVFNKVAMWIADAGPNSPTGHKPRRHWWLLKLLYLMKCAFCQSFWFFVILGLFGLFLWAWVFPCALINLTLDKILVFTNRGKK